MIPLLNALGFGLVLFLFTKTIAVCILRFFKYKSLADRFCLVTSSDGDAMNITRTFIKCGLFFPFISDLAKLYEYKQSIIFSESMNACTVTVGFLLIAVITMCILGTLITWHENIKEK